MQHSLYIRKFIDNKLYVEHSYKFVKYTLFNVQKRFRWNFAAYMYTMLCKNFVTYKFSSNREFGFNMDKDVLF